MGANAHGKVLDYIDQLNPGGVFMEVGMDVMSSKINSTAVIHDIADKYGFDFYTIEPAKEIVDKYTRELPEIVSKPNFNLINDTGENFLQNYNGKPISYVYLDNFDWMYEPERYWKYQEPEWQHEQYLEYQIYLCSPDSMQRGRRL